MKKGSECGMVLHDYSDLKPGDRVVFYEEFSRRPTHYVEEAREPTGERATAE